MTECLLFERNRQVNTNVLHKPRERSRQSSCVGPILEGTTKSSALLDVSPYLRGPRVLHSHREWFAWCRGSSDSLVVFTRLVSFINQSIRWFRQITSRSLSPVTFNRLNIHLSCTLGRTPSNEFNLSPRLDARIPFQASEVFISDGRANR